MTALTHRYDPMRDDYEICHDYLGAMPEGCGLSQEWSGGHYCACKSFIERTRLRAKFNYGYYLRLSDYE